MVNSEEFITKMGQTKLGEDEILVSFDVVSLFTNVPVDEACNIQWWRQQFPDGGAMFPDGGGACKNFHG